MRDIGINSYTYKWLKMYGWGNNPLYRGATF
jgi:hypothetical protein